MSKFNPETVICDLSKKVAALTMKITAQSTLIEAQNKKIEDQQQVIQNSYTNINELMRVVGELSTKVDKLLLSPQYKSEIGNSRISKSFAEGTSEMDICPTENPIWQNDPNVTIRTRRLTKGTNDKATFTLARDNIGNFNTLEQGKSCQQNIVKNPETVDDGWKKVIRKKAKFTAKTAQTGGNSKISSFQAIQKKKFLHVWSLHPDTSEEAIKEHVKSIIDSEDINVEKIIPKTRRDYSSFRVGIPESQFDKVNNTDSWPVNTQFNEWIWFRPSYKTTKGA